jgi:hypothetical protein
MVWTGDLGVTDIAKHKELRFLVRHRDRRYRCTVFDDDSFAIDTVDPKSLHWYAADLNVGTQRHMIGYVIRRAVCRGIDKCEITEDANSAEIDLGEWSGP